MVGTRPEAIKQAPVARALQSLGITPLLVLTGQQQVDAGAYGPAGYARLALDCPGRQDPHQHVREVAAALLPHLQAHRPELLIVQGDTSSALGGARAGFVTQVPVAHVEAGLRTHGPLLPWPEEEYRVAIDAAADLLFAPTDVAVRNLRNEQVPGEIHLTGNTAIDALVAVERGLPARRLHESGLPRLLVTCHRRESWGQGLVGIALALRRLATEQPLQIDLLLHPNAHVAATMQDALAGTPNLRLLAPCSHAELIERMRDADLILSDSGGIQEEAPALGTPLLVLRDKTERPEAVATGNARLVGTDANRIIGEIRRLLADPLALAAMSRHSFPFGDGSAAPRIARVVEDWLARRNGQESLLRVARN